MTELLDLRDIERRGRSGSSWIRSAPQHTSHAAFQKRANPGKDRAGGRGLSASSKRLLMANILKEGSRLRASRDGPTDRLPLHARPAGGALKEQTPAVDPIHTRSSRQSGPLPLPLPVRTGSSSRFTQQPERRSAMRPQVPTSEFRGADEQAGDDHPSGDRQDLSRRVR